MPCPNRIQSISTAANLHVSINQCRCKLHPYIHQPWGGVRSNAWLVLKLKLIVGNLSFSFSANDLRASACILFVRAREIYISALNKYESFEGSFLLVSNSCVVKLVNFSKYFIMLHEFQKVVNWISLSFFFSCSLNWSYVHWNVESIHKTQTGFALFFNDYQILLFL